MFFLSWLPIIRYVKRKRSQERGKYIFETARNGRYLVRGIDEDGFIVSEAWADIDFGVNMMKSSAKTHMGAHTCSVFNFASPFGYELKGDDGRVMVFHKDNGFIPRVCFGSDPTRKSYKYFQSLSGAIAFANRGQDGSRRLEVGYEFSLGFTRFADCAMIEGMGYAGNVKVMAYCRQTKDFFGNTSDRCLLIALPVGETTEVLNEIDHKSIWPEPSNAITMCLYSMRWSVAFSMFHDPHKIEPVFYSLDYDRKKGVFYKK